MGEEPAPEGDHQETVSCRADPGYCPGDDDEDPGQENLTASGGSSIVASGGSSSSGGANSEEEPGMAGAPNLDEPTTPNSFRLEGEGLLAYPGESGPLTYYSPVTLPDNTLVEATLDDIILRTGVGGSLTFLLEACEPAEDDTELCQLTVTTFGGSPSGSPEVDAPLDLRLGGYDNQVNYVTSAVRQGDSWSAHIRPEGMDLHVYRWDGAVIEERYKDGELFFMRVEEETRYDYTLPITDIEVSCTWEVCSLSLLAGSN